jgi:malate dehydrogenase (oxaloacetate-decarboxylating)(NADP+)
MANGSSDPRTIRISAQEALAMHAAAPPGKLEIRITKPLVTARDLSLAYSPGVAEPCLEIFRDPALAYDYTSKGNMVAVVSNGTAVLGLGNLGALAGKPVMEGKVALFKRFADVDGIDLCIDTEDVHQFIECVRYLGPSFGGINLEDIKAPECFIVEDRLRELMDVPVFHDDQHGTAIVAVAGLTNACLLTGRDLREMRLVVNGAGAAAIACVELLKAMGTPHDRVILCDTKGVVYQGRTEGMNQWKSAHAAATRARTLAEAIEGADAFFGLSVKGALTQDMVRSMAARPIIFAMANPDPEISPEEARAASPHAIVATGRSDYPNQVNNVLGFPYIFRGALDVRARTINEAMKIAATEALAQLAREDVPDEVSTAGTGKRLQFGPEYIIPNAFDPRLISRLPPAVAKAAMDSGVARRPIADLRKYARELSGRLDPTANALDAIMEQVRAAPKRVVFAEGEEEKMVRSAVAFRNAGYGTPVLIGREERVRETMARLGLGHAEGLEIHNAKLSHNNQKYADFLYGRLQRRGYLLRDCQRMINQDRNVFAATMVATGDADAMVTGLTRSTSVCIDDIFACHRSHAWRNRVRPDVDGWRPRYHDLHCRHLDAFPSGPEATGRYLLWRRCGRARTGPRAARRAALALHLRQPHARHRQHDARSGCRVGCARRRFRVRWRNEPGCGAGCVVSCAASVLPPDRGRERAGDAGAALGTHHVAAGPAARRRRHHRAAADRPDACGATGATERISQPDRRNRGHRGAPGRISRRATVRTGAARVGPRPCSNGPPASRGLAGCGRSSAARRAILSSGTIFMSIRSSLCISPRRFSPARVPPASCSAWQASSRPVSSFAPSAAGSWDRMPIATDGVRRCCCL